MGFLTTIITTPRLNGLVRGNGIKVSKNLVESARLDASAVLENLDQGSYIIDLSIAKEGYATATIEKNFAILRNLKCILNGSSLSRKWIN